jgi:hypothetical protein
VLVGTGMKTGLKNRYDDPAAVGADRIVNAVAAGKHYGFPAIIVDIGTATSVEAVSGEGCYLGGAILTSLYVALDALIARTAEVERDPELTPREVSVRAGEDRDDARDDRLANPSSRKPLKFRSLAKTTASSSAVRCASVEICHCPRTSSPSKSPRTVWVFSTPPPSAKRLYLPQLRDSTQVRLCQPVSDPTASGDVQVRVQVREPLEIEGARHAPVRNLQPRFLYDLFGEEQHVYVHGARRFLPLVLAP